MKARFDNPADSKCAKKKKFLSVPEVTGMSDPAPSGEEVVTVTKVDKSAKKGSMSIRNEGRYIEYILDGSAFVPVRREPSLWSRDIRLDMILNNIEEGGRSDLSSLATPFVLNMLRTYRDHRLHTIELQYQRSYDVRLHTIKFPTTKGIIDSLYFDSTVPVEVAEAIAGRQYLEMRIWLPNPKCFVDAICCIDHAKWRTAIVQHL